MWSCLSHYDLEENTFTEHSNKALLKVEGLERSVKP